MKVCICRCLRVNCLLTSVVWFLSVVKRSRDETTLGSRLYLLLKRRPWVTRPFSRTHIDDSTVWATTYSTAEVGLYRRRSKSSWRGCNLRPGGSAGAKAMLLPKKKRDLTSVLSAVLMLSCFLGWTPMLIFQHVTILDNFDTELLRFVF